MLVGKVGPLLNIIVANSGRSRGRPGGKVPQKFFLSFIK